MSNRKVNCENSFIIDIVMKHIRNINYMQLISSDFFISNNGEIHCSSKSPVVKWYKSLGETSETVADEPCSGGLLTSKADEKNQLEENL